ncbi:MAG: tetratricopeptide repeat protein [Bacteroidia bacterium]|nr:tetratricopeptide repeat protein [Bacteroidia bacterium]MCZ2247798.1 tetratricopeptide repeat protein [Bacteroidia bacterium]
MKRIIIISIIACAVALLMSSCGNSKKSEVGGKEFYQKQIDSVETQLYGNKKFAIDHATAMFAIKCYEEFASYFPDDAKSADYLLKAADISQGLGSYDAALNYLNKLTTKYPNYKNKAWAILMKAIIYGDVKGDTAQARIYYNEVITQYPESELAKDAEASIKNLGKSPEELIRSFEENQSKAN